MGRRVSRHGQGPTPPRREGLLRIMARVSAFLALAVAWVVPIQFSDAHHAAAARAIASTGAPPRAVLEVRQEVTWTRGWSVDSEVALYRTHEGGTATVRLHGYDESAIVAERQGWFSVPGSSGDVVYVSSDGRFGMLATDYQAAIGGEFDGLYLVADAWVAGWVLLGLGALLARALSQVRRSAATTGQAGLAPVLYMAGAIALLAVAYGLSFPLARSS
jgi:hypothetical protein